MTTQNRFLWILVAAIWLASIPAAGAMAQSGKVTFRAKASDLFLQIDNPLLVGKVPNDEISVNLEGELFEPPVVVTPAAPGSVSFATPQATIASFLAANRAGDVDWMARNLVAEERQTLRDFFSDADILARNRSLFQDIPSAAIMGRVHLEGHDILLVRYGGTRAHIPVPITMRQTPEGWKVTNALKADPAFDLIFAALRVGDIVASP